MKIKVAKEKIAMVMCKQYKMFQDVFDSGDYEDVLGSPADADVSFTEFANMLNLLKRHIDKTKEVDQLVVILDDHYYPKIEPLIKLTPEMGPVAFGKWNPNKKKFIKTGYIV
jgi:hypothetical protein